MGGESVGPGTGTNLGPGLSFDTERFYRLLATRDFGRPLLRYATVTSTNDTARAAAEAGAPSGTVVVAEEQTAGRGRLARAWFSPPGMGLWNTILVRPGAVRPGLATWLTLLTGVAAALALRQQSGVPLTLKWPNDLVVEGRKLGGILAESRMEPAPGASHCPSGGGREPGGVRDGPAGGQMLRYALVGLGLNVAQVASDFPPELAGRATSLVMEGARGGGLDRAALLAAILNRLEEEYLALLNKGTDGILCRYRMLCSTLGQEVTAHLGGRTIDGLATGVAADGSLLLLPSGSGEEIALTAGEVTIRPKDQ